MWSPKTKRCRDALERKNGKKANNSKRKGEDPKRAADGGECGDDPKQLICY
ncbi:hypothetical protein ACP70R_029614 [Stipagrostis hirtigluma subsp. patula]